MKHFHMKSLHLVLFLGIGFWFDGSNLLAETNPWTIRQVARKQTVQSLFKSELRAGDAVVGFIPAGAVSSIKLISGNWVLLSDHPQGWVNTSQLRRYFTAGECFASRLHYLPDYKELCPATNALIERGSSPETTGQYVFKVCQAVKYRDEIRFEWQTKTNNIPGVCYPTSTD